jgi:tight adherence protein C
MPQTYIAGILSASRAAPLLGIAVLLLAGAGMIVSSLRLRAQALSRRVTLVQLQSSGASPAGHRPLVEEYRFKEGSQGLSAAEQQQIARLFFKIKIPPERAIRLFILLRLSIVSVLACAAYFVMRHAAWQLPLLRCIASAIAGWFIPLVAVRMALKTHSKAVGSGLPDALELLAICVDAGTSLESALKRVSHQLETSQPELAQELALTWAQISILPDKHQALINLADRVRLPSLRSVVGTLSQSIRFGTPLAQSLRTAASEMRNEQLITLEERANRLPALLTVPVMLMIMPTIFLIVGGPAVLKIMDIFSAPGVTH